MNTGWLRAARLLVTTFAAALSLAAVVHAQSDAGPPAPPSSASESEGPPGYKELVTEAVSEHVAGNYPEAKALFEHAHRLHPNARTLRGLGIVSFELRSYVDSVRYLEAAVVHPVKPLPDALREDTRQLLVRAGRFVSRAHLELQPAETLVRVDGAAPAEETGASRMLLLNIGERRLRFEAPGHVPEERTVQARGGEELRIELALTPLAPVDRERAGTAPPVLETVPVAPIAELASEAGPTRSALAAPAEPLFVSERPQRAPLYKNPWLWSGVGAAVVAIVVISIVATRDSDEFPTKTMNTPPGGVFHALESAR